jgi:hypothetical protein
MVDGKSQAILGKDLIVTRGRSPFWRCAIGGRSHATT